MNSLEKRRPGASREEEGERQTVPCCHTSALLLVPRSGGASAEEGQHVVCAVRGCKCCALETEMLQYEEEDGA